MITARSFLARPISMPLISREAFASRSSATDTGGLPVTTTETAPSLLAVRRTCTRSTDGLDAPTVLGSADAAGAEVQIPAEAARTMAAAKIVEVQRITSEPLPELGTNTLLAALIALPARPLK